jgi:hypothetical protein
MHRELPKKKRYIRRTVGSKGTNTLVGRSRSKPDVGDDGAVEKSD